MHPHRRSRSITSATAPSGETTGRGRSPLRRRRARLPRPIRLRAGRARSAGRPRRPPRPSSCGAHAASERPRSPACAPHAGRPSRRTERPRRSGALRPETHDVLARQHDPHRSAVLVGELARSRPTPVTRPCRRTHHRSRAATTARPRVRTTTRRSRGRRARPTTSATCSRPVAGRELEGMAGSPPSCAGPAPCPMRGVPRSASRRPPTRRQPSGTATSASVRRGVVGEAAAPERHRRAPRRWRRAALERGPHRRRIEIAGTEVACPRATHDARERLGNRPPPGAPAEMGERAPARPRPRRRARSPSRRAHRAGRRCRACRTRTGSRRSRRTPRPRPPCVSASSPSTVVTVRPSTRRTGVTHDDPRRAVDQHRAAAALALRAAAVLRPTGHPSRSRSTSSSDRPSSVDLDGPTIERSGTGRGCCASTPRRIGSMLVTPTPRLSRRSLLVGVCRHGPAAPRAGARTANDRERQLDARPRDPTTGHTCSSRTSRTRATTWYRASSNGWSTSSAPPTASRRGRPRPARVPAEPERPARWRSHRASQKHERRRAPPLLPAPGHVRRAGNATRRAPPSTASRPSRRSR